MYLTKSLIPVSRQLKTHTNQSSNQLSIPGFYGGVLKPKCDLYHCELQVLSQVTAFVFAHTVPSSHSTLSATTKESSRITGFTQEPNPKSELLS